MNRIILLYLVFLIFTSCNSQNNKNNIEKIQEKMKTNKDSLPYNFDANDFHGLILNYEDLYNSIKEKKYHFPNEEKFILKIKDIYKEDLYKSKYRILILSKMDKFPEEVLLYEKLIIHNTYQFDNIEKDNIKDYDIFIHSVVQYNKMVFYNDIESTNWIKIHEPEYLIALVRDYGYTGNKDWLKFAFGSTDFSKPYNLESFLFESKCLKYNENYENDNFCGKSIIIVRKDMLNKMIELGAELSQLSTIATPIKKSKEDEYTGDNKELYAYLMERSYKAGQWGIIEYEYDNSNELKELFIKYNYFGNEELKDFTEKFYLPPNARYGESSLSPDPFDNWGIINDPDGYTNMRDDKSTKAPIKKKILKGEKFGIESDINNNEEEWWFVRTSEGMRGWVHKSRVTIIKDYYFGKERDMQN